MTRQTSEQLTGRLGGPQAEGRAPGRAGRSTGAGYAAVTEQAGSPPALPARGRRSVPRVLMGVGLVVVCALVFALLATRTASTVRVLALAHDVAAGQVLVAGDLTTVEVSSRDPLPGLVPAGQEKAWLGRTLTGPLPTGQLLTGANLGPPTWPPAGQAVVAVPIQAGHLPAGVVVGSQIRVVLPAPSSSPALAGGSGAGSPGGGTGQSEGSRAMPAAVVQIAGLPATGTPASGGSAAAVGTSASVTGEGAVLSLLMSSQDAAAVAASSGGNVAVVLQGRGAGG